MGLQGGAQADGDWPDFPDSSRRGWWVATNAGDHGYGCACIDADVDGDRVTRIHKAVAKPIAACRADPAVRRKEPH